MKDYKFMDFLAIFFNSVFQDFESFRRTEIDLVEEDIRLVLDEYNSNFIAYELQPGTYNFKDISDVLFNILQPENPGFGNVVGFEFDDITMKTKMVVRPGNIAINFDEKPCFSFLLVFTPHWDFKHYNE